MLRRFRTSDCPDADGRTPAHGEQKWTLSFPLEGGDDYLEVEIGRKGREALLTMLAQEDADDAAAAEQPYVPEGHYLVEDADGERYAKKERPHDGT